jgi:deoxyhypusine monooxygenase
LQISAFASIDPAPPLAQAQGAVDISSIKSTLLDMRLPLFQRFRAMFTLRDLASPPNAPSAVPAVQALAAGFSDPSALFRHEIAFVFGQLSHPASIPSLVEVLGNLTEESMVRHEAAEALGSLGEEEGVEEILKGFLNDREQIVRESVIVALDMAEFENSDEAEYAMLPSKEEFSPLATIKT